MKQDGLKGADDSSSGVQRLEMHFMQMQIITHRETFKCYLCEQREFLESQKTDQIPFREEILEFNFG